MKNPKKLAWIRTLPCTICGDNTSTEAAHIRMGDARAAKDNPGMGAKPSDLWVTPLCNRHHDIQHRIGERIFWRNEAIDPLFVAMALDQAYPSYTAALTILEAARAIGPKVVAVR